MQGSEEYEEVTDTNSILSTRKSSSRVLPHMVLLPYHPPPRKGNDYEEICPSEYECHQSSASEVDCNADNYEEINVDQSITSFESDGSVAHDVSAPIYSKRRISTPEGNVAVDISAPIYSKRPKSRPKTTFAVKYQPYNPWTVPQSTELNVYDYPADYEELKEEDMAFILTARDAFVTAPSAPLTTQPKVPTFASLKTKAEEEVITVNKKAIGASQSTAAQQKTAMEISKKARIEKIQQETSIKEKRNWAQMEKKQRHAQVEEVQKSSRTKEPIGKRVEMKKTAAATVIERPSNAMSTKVPLHLLDLKKTPKPTSNEVHVKQQVMSVIEAKQREVIEERFREMEEKQLDWQQLELEQHLEQKRIEAQWQQERINQQLKVLEAKQQLQQVSEPSAANALVLKLEQLKRNQCTFKSKNINPGNQVYWYMEASDENALGRADPFFSKKKGWVPEEKRNYKHDRTNLVITPEILSPKNCDYHDLVGSESVQYVVERGTSMNPTKSVEELMPNYLKNEELVYGQARPRQQTDVLRRLKPIRPKQTFKRDACMSIQSVKADNGRNLYVRLTDYVFDDEIELGCVFAFDHPPVTTATTGESLKLQREWAKKTKVKETSHFPLREEIVIKGVTRTMLSCEMRPPPCETENIKGKKLLPRRHRRPLDIITRIPQQPPDLFEATKTYQASESVISVETEEPVITEIEVRWHPPSGTDGNCQR